MYSPIIEVTDLRRDYVSRKGFFKHKKTINEALKGISFSVDKGEFFSLLGPNGAGKTTTIRILTTLLFPTGGKARVCGYDVEKDYRKIQEKISFIYGGERSLYWRLTAEENLRYFADLMKLPYRESRARIAEVMAMTGLEGKNKDKVETFSKGMRQRLQIARALLGKPEILFLDEPTIGLDPVGARDFRDLIRRHVDEGMTIFYTTHYMPEADELSDRIGIIRNGEILDIDTPLRLKSRYCGFRIVAFDHTAENRSAVDHLKQHPMVEFCHVKEGEFSRQVELKTLQPEALAEDLKRSPFAGEIANLHYRDGSLEDAYINLMAAPAGVTP